RGQYSFLQDLLKRVAYETLGKQERKTRHLAAAAHLRDAYGAGEQEIVEVLAAHYLDAYRAAPDAEDAPEIRTTAREMLTRGGARCRPARGRRVAPRAARASARAHGPSIRDPVGRRARRGSGDAGRGARTAALLPWGRGGRRTPDREGGRDRGVPLAPGGPLAGAQHAGTDRQLGRSLGA